MLSLFGTIAILFALFFSLLQTVVPLFGYWRNNPFLLAFARPAAYGQGVYVFIAYVLLTIAFVNNEFTIAYVATNSHPTLPLLYRLSALWGSHEGSILLWIVMLNIWTIAFSFHNNLAYRSLTLAIIGLISFFFLCFLLFTSNPFLTATTLQTGRDLNPLLQDPGFIIHPPMLYMGYVGFSVTFAITQAALLQGNLNQTWATLTRQFAIAAWCFLTLGIALGSLWAYRVLGWGGFWFWDPVENASLLPWLAGTAFIHVLRLVEKRGMVRAWAALLALISFALSLLGTFLVRSGILISVHSFARDPSRGVFLLALLALLTTLALLIYLTRLSTLSSPPSVFSLLSREMGLLINSVLLFVAMLTILLGTLYPLIIDAFHLGTLSVGAPYFNTVMAPLIFLMMIFMGFVPLCRWQQQSFSALWRTYWKNMLLSVVSALVFLTTFTHQLDFLSVATLTISIMIIVTTLPLSRFYPGMTVAHIGFALIVIGIMLSSLLNVGKEARIKPGDAIHVGPYQFFFLEVQGVIGSNFRGVRADFDVIKGTRHIVNLYPEKRIYPVRDMVMTKVDIHPGIFRDLYIALGEPYDNDYWSVRIYYKPFIRFIWIGGLLMMLGCLISIMERNRITGIG